MVRALEEAIVAAAESPFGAGVDSSLCDDRCIRLAGLAGSRVRRRSAADGRLCLSARSQRRVDTSILWITPARSRLRRYRAPLALDHRHYRAFLADPRWSRVTALALPRLGYVRHGAQSCGLAPESVGGIHPI